MWSLPPGSAIVVRHGESEWNVLGKWQGRADTNLTEAGRVQALRAAEQLVTANVDIERVVASSLIRARETAEIIAEHLGLPRIDVDDRLVETDVGPWEGLCEHEIEAGWPNYLRDRRTPPNFESPDDVFTRATSAIRDILDESRRANRTPQTLVVSHSGVLRTIRRRMKLFDRRLHNLEGCHFTLDSGGNLVAGDIITLVAGTHATTNDSV